MKKPLLLLLQFLLALVQHNLVTVKGFLSPLRTILTLQKVSIEVFALRSVISTEPCGGPSSNYSDVPFLMEVPAICWGWITLNAPQAVCSTAENEDF